VHELAADRLYWPAVHGPVQDEADMPGVAPYLQKLSQHTPEREKWAKAHEDRHQRKTAKKASPASSARLALCGDVGAVLPCRALRKTPQSGNKGTEEGCQTHATQATWWGVGHKKGQRKARKSTTQQTCEQNADPDVLNCPATHATAVAEVEPAGQEYPA
jgi:hypothetical protein